MSESLGDTQMKQFILITDELVREYVHQFAPAPMIVEQVEEIPAVEEIYEHPMLQECRDLVFKMRSIMEDSGGDYALGFEMGMQRAADMMENLIKRFEKNDGDDFE